MIKKRNYLQMADFSWSVLLNKIWYFFIIGVKSKIIVKIRQIFGRKIMSIFCYKMISVIKFYYKMMVSFSNISYNICDYTIR